MGKSAIQLSRARAILSASCLAVSVALLAPGARAEDIDVTVGDRTGVITVNNANHFWVTNADGTRDLVLVYSNAQAVASGGTLKLGTGSGEKKNAIWAQAKLLVVGGGGGGGFVNKRTLGRGSGAGGGAGGLIEKDFGMVDSSPAYSIVVGAGGAGATSNLSEGADGGNSSFSDGSSSVEAYGGGGGGAQSVGHGSTPGKPLGSGGGGSRGGSPVANMPGGAGTDGQGHSGGAGVAGYSGGGGGGAGADGADGKGSDAGGAGKGGDGLPSMITGREVWYAGGGGGAFANPNNTTNDKYEGGAGGTGGGGSGAGVDGGAGGKELNPIPAKSGADGFGGGGGGGSSHVDATTPAGNGGSGVVIVRLSGFIVGGVPVPVPQGPFTYDGNAHTGVVKIVAYELTGTPIATNAGTYHVTATIPATAPYEWIGGGKGSRSCDWTINKLAVEAPVLRPAPTDRPDYYRYGNAARNNSEEKVAIDVTKLGFSTSDDTCSTNGLKYCKVTGYRATNVGDYEIVAELINEPVANFVWKNPPPGGTTASPWRIPWAITKAENSISNLKLASWQKGTTAPKPTCNWQWENVIPRIDVVKYQWKAEGEEGYTHPAEPVTAAGLTMPTEPGVYYLRAYICEDSVHGNWVDAEQRDYRFFIWRHPSEVLTDYVDITISGYSGGAAVSDFPVLVRLREPVDGGKGGGIPGFTYARAGDGSELRFISISTSSDYNKRDDERTSKANDKLLPYEVESWNAKGESLVWVKIPSVTSATKFRMYFHRKVGEKVIPDILPNETWSSYAGVWHFNAFDTSDTTAKSQASSPNATAAEGIDAHIAHTPGTLTNQEGLLGTGVQTAEDANGAGIWMKDPGENSPLDGGSKFVISGWFKHYGADYSWDHIFYKRSRANNKDTDYKNPYINAFAIEVSNQAAKFPIAAYGSSSSTTAKTPPTDPNGKWVQLAFVYDSTSCSIYENGTLVDKKFTIAACTDNDAPLAVGNNSNYEVEGSIDSPWRGLVDEVRFVKGTKDVNWVKAEYDTVVKTNFCTFGLVSQMQTDGEPSWVNWWTTEPTLKRYWDKGELTEAKVNLAHGALKAGSVENLFTKMPEGTPVDFPNANEFGAYIVEFTMQNMDAYSISPYKGRHLLFDGSRFCDLEIVGHRPEPIDPDGPEGATFSGRVLTANDDTNTAHAVALQSYWRSDDSGEELNPFWKHGDGPVLDLGLNILPRSQHALRRALPSADGLVTNDLWNLDDVYIGNMMTNDPAATGTAILSNRWNTLPWSSTSVAIREKDKPFDHTEVGQFLMRNIGGDSAGGGAEIRSGVFTNGVGTVYFDAVNAYALDDVNPNHYKLVVEYDDPAKDDGTLGNWRPAEMTVLYAEGGTISPKFEGTTNELACLDVTNGGKTGTFRFYRAYAKLDRRVPTRVRIRRTSNRVNEGGTSTGDDDPDGFIALDNIIVSWPAPLPRIVPVGSYDKTRFRDGRAVAPILGVEGAFDIAYPSATDAFYPNIRLEGGVATNVASARMHYRWRYADAFFEPERRNGRDFWKTSYLVNVTNEFFTTREPLSFNGLPGDVEYWYDLTALAPYYEYVDYTGRDLKVAGYSEEPEKNMPSVASPGEYAPANAFPSHGTNWFMRLREWSNPRRGWWLVYRTSDGAAQGRLALELTGAREWRACLQTRTPLKGLQVRFESETPAGSDAAGIHFTTNLWTAESTTTLPKRLTLTEAETARWADVPCDALTGHLMFLVDEERSSVMVSRADWQDFNMWTSGVSTNGLFSGSSVDTNVTSYTAQESDADMSAWPISVATNAAWTLNFDSPGLVAAEVYPRNEPFSYRKVNGWTVENGMWTYGKWSLQNKEDPWISLNDETALQMTGRGYGRLSFTEAADSPDGLDTISYRARVAQYIEFDNVTYFNTWIPAFDPVTGAYAGGQMSQDMTNYTFATCVALTAKEGGKDLYDGDGSVSLFAYYRDKVGAYELRVSRGWNETSVRLALYRWKSSAGAMVCEKLLDSNTDAKKRKNYFDFDETGETATDHRKANINRMVRSGLSPLGGLFISVKEKDGATLVTAGLRRNDVNVTMGMESESGQSYACIAYKDTSTSRLTRGSFGVLACNCPGVFVKPLFWKSGLDAVTPSENNVLVKKNDQTITFLGDRETEICREPDLQKWAVESGRMEKLVSLNNYFGFQAKAPLPQQVVVQIAPYKYQEKTQKWIPTSDWMDIYTNTVNGFTSETYHNVVRDARQCDVRLLSPGKPDDVRADVTLDNITLTQWNGQWTKGYDSSSLHYLTNAFVYTSAWITGNEWGAKMVKLQPTRARNASTPVSLRSSLLRGLGLFHFKWRWADPNARVRVQIKENVTEGSIVGATETLESGATEEGNGWVDFETIPVGESPEGGSWTSYINRRYHGQENGKDYYFCLVRVVIDRDVEAAALSNEHPRNDPEYGAVEISEAFAVDLPEYDKHSWSGWNFRTAGWNGDGSDEFGNLTDGFRGLSGLLNNTLDENTLADREKGHYNQRMPGVQSPTFLTNCIAAVSFRARLYGPSDIADYGHCAVVTVLGTSVLDDKGEPVDGTWVESGDVFVSNVVYGTHSVKLPSAQNFKAIRLVVKGVKDVQETLAPDARHPDPVYDPPLRVAIDDICVWERQSQSVAFRKLHVRPFRDATAIKGTDEVKDIDKMAEQPLVGESFGFQAEVEVLDPDEVLVDDPAHPITVDLWYYPGDDVWGYENWKTNPAAVKVANLRPATDADGRFVFRSTVDQSSSLCPPQFLEDGEGYKIVQYHVVAHYYDTAKTAADHDLLPDEWSMPEWNSGFPDPNATRTGFSAFTLLEEIAPGRAWINEVNYCEPSQRASNASQWLELAVPSGVDMTGWTVTAYDFNGNKVVELATLGLRGAAKSKTYRGSDPIALASHYAFYTIKGPNTVLADADAVWPTFSNTGIFDYTYPYAFELKRPTGVIEHRVVAQGWNQYKPGEQRPKTWWTDYEGTNLVEVMNRKHGGEWTWSAEDFHDDAAANCGVSVVTNQGALHADWVSPLELTPGEINKGQYIAPDWFILPNGGYVKIYSSILGEHMRQIIGGETNTVGDMTISQGSSTNIVFEVDRWWKLGTCTVTPDDRTSMSDPRLDPVSGKNYYTLSLNFVSNSITVMAAADIADTVAAKLDPRYPEYTPAIMKWLEKGVTGGADGGEHPFKNPNGPILPMHYRGTDGSRSDEMNLPDMYWLDVDPTSGDWELWGGMGDRPGSPGTLGQVDQPIYREKLLADGSTFIHTNHLTTVWLELRNDAEGLSYPPYRIQGLGNEQSDDPSFGGAWTSGNFKVTMELRNGKVDNIFQPMRYFVFDRNSFRPKDDSVSPYAARIEITDPFSDQSPASEWGWKPYSDCGVFTGWALDGRVTPGGVSTLKKDDLLEF